MLCKSGNELRSDMRRQNSEIWRRQPSISARASVQILWMTILPLGPKNCSIPLTSRTYALMDSVTDQSARPSESEEAPECCANDPGQCGLPVPGT